MLESSGGFDFQTVSPPPKGLHVLFSKTVATDRQSAWLKLLSATQSDRPKLRPIYTRYLAALHAAEEVFLTATEDERDAAEAAQVAAKEAFEKTVNAGTEIYEHTMAMLPEAEQVARQNATLAYHDVLRQANGNYDRAVGPTALVLKVIEKRAMVAYELAARVAFVAFQNEVKAAIETTENRSPCHAGCDRFVLQEERGKR
jgi:hypothetical protein